ncbi:MAG: Abi family protein [Blautia sp.]|nr:Abi family protein [Blautia sp.]
MDEQITILNDHRIAINDPVAAKEILRQIGYYRFSGYALQFRQASSSSTCIDNTTFESIYDAYCFDQELRGILRNYLEIAEVYYKAQIGYWFALQKCLNPPHDQHYDRNNYFNKSGFDSIMNSFQAKGASYYQDSLIMKHHQVKYHGKMPLWVLLELLSFSNASMLFNAMYISEQDAIAGSVGVSRQTLVNHLHCLSVLRNRCAHAARLYDTALRPPVRFNSTFLRKHPEIAPTDTVFCYVLLLLRRLPSYEDKNRFFAEIMSLMDKYQEKISLDRIGFPENYQLIFKNSLC